MSENQFLEIIDGKIEVVKNLVEQQTKSGVFFDGFTKQVLEKINDKLDTLSGMETNELITYLTKEIKNSLEERHLVIQERLDGVQGQINAIQNNLVDSLKSPEIAAIFTKLSDTVLDFSRNLNSQTKYFNSTVEDIQKEIAKVNVDEKFIAQTNSIRLDIERYKIDVASVVDSINSNFKSMQNLIEETQNPEMFTSLTADISILQKSLNDIVSVITVIEDKQTDFINSIKDISSLVNTEDVKLGVSSTLAEMQALKDSLNVLANKSDIEFLNEKIGNALNEILELKDLTKFNDNENKSTLKNYFDNLHILISSYLSKEENEIIKNKLEYIQSKIISSEETLKEEIKNIIPIFSSLSTVENIKELAENTAKVINDISYKIENKLNQNSIDYQTQIDSLKVILSDIHKTIETMPLRTDSSDKTEALKGEINIIADYISNVSEKLSDETTQSVSEIKNYLEDVSAKISEKIDSLESFTNFVQDKNSEVTNKLEELKDFSQKVTTLVSALNIEVGLKNENLKQTIESTQKSINEKIDNLKTETKEDVNNVLKISGEINSNIDKLTTTNEEKTNQITETISKQANFIRELETKVLLCADSTVKNIETVENINNSVENLDKKIGQLTSVYANSTNQLASNIAHQGAMINNLESKVVMATNSIVEKAQTEIDEKLNVITNSCGIVNNQINDVLNQQENNTKTLESKVAMLSGSIVETNRIANEVTSAVSKLDEKIINSDEQRKTAKEDILSKLSEVMISLGEKLSQSFTQRSIIKEEIITSVKDVNADIKQKLEGTNTKVDTFIEEVKQLLGTSFANISNNLSQENTKSDEFKEQLKIEIEKTISEITNKLIKADENNTALRAQLLSELEKTTKLINEKYDIQLENINNNFLQIQDGMVKNVVEEIGLEDLKVEISQDIAIYAVSLKEKIEETVAIIENNKDYLSMISTDNTTNIIDKIIDIKNDLSEIKLGNASGMVVAEIRRVGEKIEGWSNDILDTISDEVKDAFSDNIKLINDTVQDNVAIIKDDIQELVIKLSDVNAIAQDVKNAVADSFDAYLDHFYAKVEESAEDIKKHIDLNTEKLTNTILEYKKELNNIADIDLNSYKEETKQFIQEQIEILNQKIEELQLNLEEQYVPEIEQEETEEPTKNEIKEIIEDSINGINKRLELLRDILLSEVPSSDFISENFEDVRVSLNEINEKVEQLDKLENLNKLDEINDSLNRLEQKEDKFEIVEGLLNEIKAKSNDFENVNEILNEINSKTDNFENIVKSENASLKEVINRYQTELNALSNLDETSNDENTKEFIKEELNHLKEQFVRNLTSVFENISFIDESEEIQNAILDNADVIKNEINQLKQDIIANSNSTYSADQKFEKLKTILEGITTGDVGSSEKYIYTLPDVEMDIAKMRMAISEVSDLIKQNREDGFDVAERLNAVDDIKEDISSISKRTNKLILTSDDSNKYLKENIEDFKEILNAITKKCNKIDSSQLNQHLVDVKSLVMSGLKSDKILNEAFMHLAEWIDDSAKSMNTISSQVEVNKYTLSAMKTDLEKTDTKLQEIDTLKDEITQVKDSISELAFKLDKKSDMDYSKSLYDIEYSLDRISDKLDMQEMKIKSLEKKLETLSAPQDTNDETNSLLEFIASQVTAANENSRNNRLLLQKVSILEKQMNRFETSISKITQFVDGAN